MLSNQISKQFNKQFNKQFIKYNATLVESKQTNAEQTHHHINCSNCRLYIESEKSCKLYPINKLSNKKQLAIDARLNQSECGIDGKNFWQIDTICKKI